MKIKPQPVVAHRNLLVDGLRLPLREQPLRLPVALVPRGLTAQPIDRAIACRRDDPPGRTGRQTARRPPLARDHECLLDRVLGDVDVAEDADQRSDCSPVLLTEDPRNIATG